MHYKGAGGRVMGSNCSSNGERARALRPFCALSLQPPDLASSLICDQFRSPPHGEHVSSALKLPPEIWPLMSDRIAACNAGNDFPWSGQ